MSSLDASLNPVVSGWRARVIANGGADPVSSLIAVNNYWNGLVADGVDSSIVILGIYAPDNLIAALTPLVVGGGSDPWGNNGPFVTGDLTVNGLAGDGVGKYLDTGLAGNNAALSATATSFSVYRTTATGGGILADIGTIGASNVHWIGRETFWRNGDPTNNNIQPAAAGPGFYCDVRVSSTDHRVFFASSGSAFAQIGATDTAALSLPVPVRNWFVHAFSNQNGVANGLSTYRYSNAAVFNNTFNSTKAQSFFNRTQAFRVAVGGGFI